MSDFIQLTIYWKLAIFKYLSGVVKIGLMAMLAATVSVHWSSLSPFEHFTIIAACIVQMLAFTEGFVDQTAARLMAGKPPIGTNGGGTEHLAKIDH